MKSHALAGPRMLAALCALVAAAPASAVFDSSFEPLSPSVRGKLSGTFWHPGCPVTLSGLRLLTTTYWGFDGQEHVGQVVVNAKAAAPLSQVFRRLHALRFPIRHMALADTYGPPGGRPKDGDVTQSFECRQAVPSPCSGGTGTGHWSNHAYGLAIDVNPSENPYVGCGQTRDPTRQVYLNRSNLRKGMVTPAVVDAFRSVGWGWGGSWTGNTKDYMHLSADGH